MNGILKMRAKTESSAIPWIWVFIPTGLILAFFLAVSLVVLGKINDLNDRLKVKSSAEELSRTRYESEMKELHEIKVKIDYNQSVYQDDLRRILLKEVK